VSAGDVLQARAEAEKALNCLFIAVEEPVARDVATKVRAAFEAYDQIDRMKTREINLLVRENKAMLAVMEKQEPL
jgi:hypothetical protein